MKKILIKCKRCGHLYTVDEQLLIDQSQRIKNAKQSRLDGAFANMSTGFNMYNDPEYQRNEMLIKRELLDAQNMTTCPSCGCHEYVDCTKAEVDRYNKNMHEQRAAAEKQAVAIANAAEEKAKRDAAFATPINPNAKVEDLIERIVDFIEDKEWYMAEHYIEHCLDMDPKNYYLYYLKLLEKNRASNDSEIINKRIIFDENDKDYIKLMKYADESFVSKINNLSFESLVLSKLDKINDLSIQEADKQFTVFYEVAKKASKEELCEKINNALKKKKLESVEDADNNIETIKKELDYENLELLKIKKVDEAIDLYKSANYIKSYIILKELGLLTKTTNCTNSIFNDIFKFGSWGEEQISWVIIDYDEKNHKALLLSKYVIDCKCYNNSEENCTWETSSLREWLNDEFFNGAFADEEKHKIEITNVVNNNSLKKTKRCENDTTDRIFLLSINEVKKYFKNKFERVAKPTNFAKKINNNGEHLYVWENGNCDFWLRTLIKDNIPSFVGGEGIIEENGLVSANCPSYGVRPSMWVSY